MILNYLKIKNSKKGISLVEVLVVLFIISLFTGILISNFPKIRRQFALNRAIHKIGQDLRRVQDMGLSGRQIRNSTGDLINTKGYGLYVNFTDPSFGEKKYFLYADVDNDQRYSLGFLVDCGQQQPGEDCILETIDLDQSGAGLFISSIENINNASGELVDINFQPPNPIVKISDLLPGKNNVDIVFSLKLDPSITRSVSVNTAGLIEIK